MIVWIEGVDGAGKTTLCQTLRDTYGYSVVNGIARQSDKIKEHNYWRQLICKLQDTGTVWIMDRSPITELVYRLVDTDPSYMSGDLLKELCLCNRCVLCTKETAFKDAQTRGEDNITNYQLHSKLTHLYPVITDFLHRHFGLPVIEYDHTKDDIAKVIKFINFNGRIE